MVSWGLKDPFYLVYVNHWCFYLHLWEWKGEKISSFLRLATSAPAPEHEIHGSWKNGKASFKAY